MFGSASSSYKANADGSQGQTIETKPIECENLI